MENFDKSKNVTPDLQACDMKNRQSNPKTAVWCKIKGQILRILQLRFNRGQRLTFCLNFMPICPLTKKCEFTVHVTKKLTPFSPLFCALWPRAPKFSHEIWVRPTYACKILSGSVKVCRSYLRKANFEQIHITLSSICTTAYN